jgi:hypothetical protein
VRVTVFFTEQQSQTTQLHAHLSAVAVTTIGSRVTVRVTEAFTGNPTATIIKPSNTCRTFIIIFASLITG